MRTGTTIAASIVMIMVGLLTLSPARAQEERLELDWVFSEEGKSAMSLPGYTWLDSGLVALYERSLPLNERTIETFNPGNGRRRAVVDAEKALLNMTAVLSPKEPYEELGWPDAFDPSGRLALYQKSGDIVLLDLQSSEVIPVAVTDAQESASTYGTLMTGRKSDSQLTVPTRC
jgi:hypothetical protein